MTLTVDIHAHIVAPEIARLVADQFDPAKDPFLRYGGVSTVYNQRLSGDLLPMLTDPAPRLAQMDRQGVQMQAVAIARPRSRNLRL